MTASLLTIMPEKKISDRWKDRRRMGTYLTRKVISASPCRPSNRQDIIAPPMERSCQNGVTGKMRSNLRVQGVICWHYVNAQTVSQWYLGEWRGDGVFYRMIRHVHCLLSSFNAPTSYWYFFLVGNGWNLVSLCMGEFSEQMFTDIEGEKHYCAIVKIRSTRYHVHNPTNLCQTSKGVVLRFR